MGAYADQLNSIAQQRAQNDSLSYAQERRSLMAELERQRKQREEQAQQGPGTFERILPGLISGTVGAVGAGFGLPTWGMAAGGFAGALGEGIASGTGSDITPGMLGNLGMSVGGQLGQLESAKTARDEREALMQKYGIMMAERNPNFVGPPQY